MYIQWGRVRTQKKSAPQLILTDGSLVGAYLVGMKVEVSKFSVYAYNYRLF